MKTRLLFFFLLAFSFGNAQVATFSTPNSYNITATSASISFQVTSNSTTTLYSQLATGNAGNVSLAPLSGAGGNTAGTWDSPKYLTGLTPNTTYYFRYRCDNTSGTSYSTTSSFTTLSATPIITFTNSSISYDIATINYSLNANGLATTSLVRYGLTSGNLSNQVTGSSSSGTSAIAAFANLSGLLPSTTYYFQIEAANSEGTSSSSIRSFQTQPAQQLIANYTFDNTLNDVNGTNAFASQPGMTYGTDRLNIANKALFINGTGTTVSLTNLPVGNSSRTFSFWIKPTQFNGANRIFSYGSPSGTAAYGASFDATRVYNFSWTTNLSYVQSTSLNFWKHIVCTFEQSTNTASLYIDGVLRAGNDFSWSTANNGILYLGSLFGETGSRYIGYVDDLQIYNYALNNAEVTNLYNINTLSSSSFSQNNLKVALYPNPVNDVLNIETETEIKSVAIYNLLGQKVKTSNQKQVSVAELASGTYMVRVEDTNGAVETMKIVKN